MQRCIRATPSWSPPSDAATKAPSTRWWTATPPPSWAWRCVMWRVARAAEEVVKRTWLRVIRGLDRFDGRFALRTWIFRLLAEVVNTRDGEERAAFAGLPALATLPAEQRAVVTLRDIEGWPAGDACAALGLEEADQRRLLHCARTAITGALEGSAVTLEPVATTTA